MIHGIVLAFGLAALAFVCWVWVNSRRYARILCAAHYIEVAQAAQQLKAGALVAIQDSSSGLAAEPHVLTTRAHLVIAYTIRHYPARTATPWIHHVTVHMAAGFTPHRVAAPVIVFLLRLLGIGLTQATVEITPTRVFEVEWALSDDEQANFVARAIAVPTLEQARKIHLECLRRRDELQLGHIEAN